jgi:DNA-directed RNA polymerase beta' subunit
VLQVCVPQLMALVLTYPDRVTEHNIEKLKQRVLNGGFVGGQKQAPGVTLDLMTL